MFNFSSTVWYCVWANAYVICTTVLTRFKTIFPIPTITGTKNISLLPNPTFILMKSLVLIYYYHCY